MSFVLTQPLGLLALATLPLIVWLHRHVLRGPRRQVSHLALWRTRDEAPLEGRTRTSPPPTLVLWLELGTAALLSLLLAGLDVRLPGGAQRHVGVIVDASASMTGGEAGDAPLDAALDALDELDRQPGELRVSVVAAGATPRLLGEARMTAAEARERLAALAPGGSRVRLGPALEMLAGLGVAAESTLVVSDEPTLEHRQLWRVGKPTDNAAFVAAHWRDGEAPFVSVRRLDATPRTLQLEMTLDDGAPASLHPVDLEHQAEVPLTLPVPDGVQRVELRLPADAMALDNRLTLLRPPRRRVGVHVDVEDRALREALEKALVAIPLLEAAPSDAAALTVTDAAQEGSADDEEVATPGSWVLAVRAGSGAAHAAWDLAADPFAPLAAGLDTRGLTWSTPSLEPPADAAPLITAGERSVAWRLGRVVTLAVDVKRSNLLSHSAFPILLANLAAEIDGAAGGLQRSNYRQGERLSLRRATGWEGPVTLRRPDGEERTFEAGREVLDLGALDTPGVHRLVGEGVDAHFVVNFVDPRESDLTRRAAPQPMPAVAVATSVDRTDRRGLAPWLLVLAAALAGAAWWRLRRGTGP